MSPESQLRSRVASTLRRWGSAGSLALVGVTLATALLLPVDPFLGQGDTALLYLPVVAVIATAGGTEAGVLAALFSVLMGTYLFVPPYYSAFDADPRELTSLVVFALVGLFMGLQTGLAREREAEARARRKEIEILDRLSSHLAAHITGPAVVSSLLEEVTEAVGAPEAALLEPGEGRELEAVVTSPVRKTEFPPEVLEQALLALRENRIVGLPLPWEEEEVGQSHGRAAPIPEPKDELAGAFLPLVGSYGVHGVLYVARRPSGIPYGHDAARLLRSVSHLGAVSLERQHLEAAVAQANTLRETDRLKSTLVSSVSHELKTPLASVTARITNLMEGDVEWSSGALRQELENVNEDLVRLNDSISDLLDLSRLEGGAWKPRRDWYGLGEILGSVMARLPSSARSRITFDLPEDLPAVLVDYTQWARALQHLLENALDYSPAHLPVSVGARALPSGVTMWVEDQGPGVCLDERERIFEKFYRGQAAAASPVGTGLGLTITAEIVRFHQGTIAVEEASPHGARFVVALPAGTASSKGTTE